DRVSELTEKLKATPPAPKVNRVPQVVFSSRIEVNSLKGEAEVELNDVPGKVTEGTALEFLEKEGQDPEDWEVVSLRRSEWDSPNGERLEATRVSFRRREQSETASAMPDLDDLHAAIERAVAADDGGGRRDRPAIRSEEHTSELQSRENLECRL